MQMTRDALIGMCDRLFALACFHGAESGVVTETLLAFAPDGALVGTYVGAGSPQVAREVRARSAPDVVVVDAGLDQVPDLLRRELEVVGAVAAVRVHQVHLGDGGCQVTVAGAWPAGQVAQARGASFDRGRVLVGTAPTEAATSWLRGVIPACA